jgi:FkbM family methyltransferase
LVSRQSAIRPVSRLGAVRELDVIGDAGRHVLLLQPTTKGKSVVISMTTVPQTRPAPPVSVKAAINRLGRVLFPLDSFLKKVPGVIHIGANIGQERQHYASLGLNVLWVEPIPAVFDRLCSNISGLANQRACCRLLAAEDGTEYSLHVASNEGASSSILGFAKHLEIWPDVSFSHDLQLTATTLTSLIGDEEIDLDMYGALVLDTQGSELLVLKGAIPVLKRFRFVKSEVADFEAYDGCCQLDSLTEFMRQQGFVISRKSPWITRDGIGTYYEVLYRRL